MQTAVICVLLNLHLFSVIDFIHFHSPIRTKGIVVPIFHITINVCLIESNVSTVKTVVLYLLSLCQIWEIVPSDVIMGYFYLGGLNGPLIDNGWQFCHMASLLLTFPWRISVQARAILIYTHKYKSVWLRLSVGHGEYRTKGIHCIWSCGPALPALDNRITANWTLGFSLSLCFFLSQNHSILPLPMSPAFSGIYVFSANHPLLFCWNLLPLKDREDREEAWMIEKRRRQRQKKMGGCWAEW